MQPIGPVEPDLVTIPAGDFLMGSETGADNEKPVHRVWVDAFAIARYPVTRRDYAAFLEATDIRQQSSGVIPDFSSRISLLWVRVGSTLLPTANGCPGRPANTTVCPQKPRGKKQRAAGWKGATIPGATSHRKTCAE